MATDSATTKKTSQDTPWYKRTGWIIALLILFWPVGLYLMWNYTNWNKVVKWVITGFLVVVGLLSIIGVMNPSPVLSVDNVGNGRTTTDSSEFTVTGSTGLVTEDVKVLVNGKEALWGGDKFSSTIKLSEGDNQVVVKAIKGDRTDEEKFVVHRLTAAELKAAKEANTTAEAAKQAKEKADAAKAAKANAPAEYKSALNQSDDYANKMNMSKKGVYDQLVSQYGGQFSPEAAQYAIDNVVADWDANALAQARDYQDKMNMSPAAIHDQLTSSYGGQFTQTEADYAIQNL